MALLLHPALDGGSRGSEQLTGVARAEDKYILHNLYYLYEPMTSQEQQHHLKLPKDCFRSLDSILQGPIRITQNPSA